MHVSFHARVAVVVRVGPKRLTHEVPRLTFVVVSSASPLVEGVDDDRDGIAGSTVLRPRRPDAECWREIVQPSGQPISLSHSTGVRRRTDDEGFGVGIESFLAG
jgi:hypothetical protein